MNNRRAQPGRFPLKSVLAILSATIIAFAAAPAWAQSAFPNRPIRILTQFPPGAVSDISLRILADRAGARLGAQIIVQISRALPA